MTHEGCSIIHVKYCCALATDPASSLEDRRRPGSAGNLKPAKDNPPSTSTASSPHHANRPRYAVQEELPTLLPCSLCEPSGCSGESQKSCAADDSMSAARYVSLGFFVACQSPIVQASYGSRSWPRASIEGRPNADLRDVPDRGPGFRLLPSLHRVGGSGEAGIQTSRYRDAQVAHAGAGRCGARCSEGPGPSDRRSALRCPHHGRCVCRQPRRT
jgi:hypothetical protein